MASVVKRFLGCFCWQVLCICYVMPKLNTAFLTLRRKQDFMNGVKHRYFSYLIALKLLKNGVIFHVIEHTACSNTVLNILCLLHGGIWIHNIEILLWDLISRITAQSKIMK